MELSTSLNLLIDRNEKNFNLNRFYFKSIQQCHDAGFRIIDWNAADHANKQTCAESTDLTSAAWRDHIVAMKEKADELGMRFNQCHSLMFNYFEKDPQTDFLHIVSDRVLEACSILKIPRIVYHPVVPDGMRENQNAQECKKANYEYISREAEKAGKLGVEIAIENMFTTKRTDGTVFWRYCSSPDELNDLVDTINMENVCVCLDVGHAHIMGEDFMETVPKYGKRLRALHIADNDGASDQHLLPFHGTIPWTSLLEALHKIQYPGEFTFEIHNAIIRMPQELRALMLSECYEVGKWLVKQYNDHMNR